MTKSIWQKTAGDAVFPALAESLQADVVIVGGGITGMTAAILLTRAGKKVVVVEAHRIGFGTTGGATGNLHIVPDQHLYRIKDKWNKETAVAVATSRAAALDLIEETVERFQLDCAFYRQPHYLFPTDAAEEGPMRQEHIAALEAGLAAEVVDDVPLPFTARKALKIDAQAQFHPVRFVQQLAAAVVSESCRIFENSPVVEIDSKNCRVRTAGGEVQAAAIMLATHTPVGFNFLHTEVAPYREYGIAGRIPAGSCPVGIFWTLEEPSHSIRACESDGSSYLIAIGEEHKTGQQDNSIDYFRRVEDYARARFNLESVEFRWSAQNYQPADMLPYIGRTAAADDLYVATGFGTNGLLYGPLAAMIVTDTILGQPNRWEEIYQATRFAPLQGAEKFIKENLDVAKQYLKDYLTAAEREQLKDVQPGEGRVAELAGRRVAVYRDEADCWSAVSPVCTHLGCIVHWNRQEKSWDCPCHGSRFHPDGTVIEGPAMKPLERKELRLDS